MKKLCFTLLALSMPFLSIAGEAKITWKDFNDYHDVHPANEAKRSYHKRVTKHFEKHISKLAEQLPEGYKLNVTFDDIDLAGDSRMGMQEIRVIKRIYFPKLTISYALQDKSGVTVSSAEKLVLKDMSFMDRINKGLDKSFIYEKQLLSDWFADQVLIKTNA